jgi:hypothetical protein
MGIGNTVGDWYFFGGCQFLASTVEQKRGTT